MIITDTKRNIEKIGEFKENAFSIRATGKSFRILISNLYPDKVRAVQNELSANSTDSHILKGIRDVPIHVSLPTFLEPKYEIEDFGVGLSHDYMMNEYCQIFYSTKDKDNSQAGSFGLGRVSALSICDNYLVESVQNKVKNVYSVFINGDGIPAITHLGAESTEKESGFLVNVPVNPGLIGEFEEKSKKIYAHYKVKPIIKNFDGYEIPETKYILLADDGSFGLTGRGSNSLAIMANYAYPIDINSLPDLSDTQKAILRCGLIVHFDTGDISPTANREAIDYTKHSIDNIEAKLDLIAEQIKPIITKEFEGKTIFKKLELQGDLFDYEGKLSGLKSIAESLNINVNQYLELKEFEIFQYTYGYGRRGRTRKLQENKIGTYHYGKNHLLFYGDKTTHLKARVKKYFEVYENQNKKLIVFVPKTDKALENFQNDFKCDLTVELPAISTLPFDKPIYNKGSGVQRKLLTFSATHWYRRDSIANAWAEKQLNGETEIVYIGRAGYRPSHLNGVRRHEMRNFIDKINEYKKLRGITDLNLFGLTERQIKNLKKSGIKLIEFFADYRAALCEHQKLNEENFAAAKYFYSEYENFPADWMETLDISNNTFITPILAEYKALQAIMATINQADVTGDVKKSDKYLYSSDLLKERYPLLFAVDHYNYGKKEEVIKDLNEYIKNKSVVLPTLPLTKCEEKI